MTNNGNDRLDRIEAILQSIAERQLNSDRALDATRNIVESNARAIQSITDRQLNSDRALEVTRNIVESNARAIQSIAERQLNSDRALEATRNIVESNARAIQSITDRQLNSDRALEATRNIAESNARSIQAMMEQRTSDMLEHQEKISRLDNLVERLVRVQEGMTRMLSSIDDDRPTVLRKLNTIENKVDRLLSRNKD